jgi:6-phosphogluconolactonase
MTVHRDLFPDPAAAAQASARCIFDRLDNALSERGGASLAVSGGSTPKIMFQTMAQETFNWSRVHLFWVDERTVLPTDPQSNYKLAHDYFIGPAEFPHANVHRIVAELPPQEAAAQYASDIREFFGLTPGEIPRFDIVHCGMGPEGHTASLFPGEALIGDRKNLAAAVYVDKLKTWRITMLPGLLLGSRDLVLLVAGQDKATALHTVFDGTFDPQQCPAQIYSQARGDVHWFLDKPAAALIEE